jgi:hypothetical protein
VVCTYFCRLANNFHCGQGELMLNRATKSGPSWRLPSLTRPRQNDADNVGKRHEWSRRPATVLVAPTDLVCGS